MSESLGDVTYEGGNTIHKSVLWELADQWEDIIRDKKHVSPMTRFVMQQVYDQLTVRLGKRELPKAWPAK